jgi:hypothetical protein
LINSPSAPILVSQNATWENTTTLVTSEPMDDPRFVSRCSEIMMQRLVAEPIHFIGPLDKISEAFKCEDVVAFSSCESLLLMDKVGSGNVMLDWDI